MSKTQTEANKLLDLRYGDGTYSKPATVYLGLFTAAPTTTTAGTEVTGGSYGRVAATNDATMFPDAVARTKTNAAALIFAPASAPWGTIVAFGWFDALVAGNLLDFATLATPKIITTGDTPEFAAGQLSFTEN